MERVAQMLRTLFDRVLGEHEQDAPALTDIVIETARGDAEPRLWAQFSNGYRVWAALRPAEFYAFCEARAAWDLESLRRALLREAHGIYAQMLAARLAEPRPSERRTPLAEQVRRLGDELRRIYEPQRGSRFSHFIGFRRRSSLFGEVVSKEAEDRGVRLLEDNLSPTQGAQYRKHRYFDVIGGKTGRRYRIGHGRQMNIDQLDKRGRRVCGWCFFPAGGLVTGDVMLAQKMALELFEGEALDIANRF